MTLDLSPPEPGARPDLLCLAPYHYHAGLPATTTRVLRVRDRGLSGSGPQTVAVLAESRPRLACPGRERALPTLAEGWLSPAERARLINRQIRTISRVIVDPRYRGLGLAGLLVRAALATAATPITESLAAMGSVHPFFARAGMTAVPLPTPEPNARLLAALQTVYDTPHGLLADPARGALMIRQRPPGEQQFLIAELRRWAARQRRARPRSRDLPDLLRAAGKALGKQRVYFFASRPSGPRI